MTRIQTPAPSFRSKPHSNSRVALEQWRRKVRPQWLERLAACAAKLAWNQQLLLVLLEELWIDEAFVDLVGEPSQLPEERYPEAIGTALLLRHSWRPEDLIDLAQKLGILRTRMPAKTYPAKARRAAARAREQDGHSRKSNSHPRTTHDWWTAGPRLPAGRLRLNGPASS